MNGFLTLTENEEEIDPNFETEVDGGFSQATREYSPREKEKRGALDFSFGEDDERH